MNWMIWNTRGTGARSFPALVRDLKKHYKLDFLAVLETRCAPDMAVNRVKQLGFHHYALIDAEGFRGGLWCLWDDSINSITVVEQNSQFLNLQVQIKQERPWLCTIVYASPQAVHRRVLWQELTRIESTVDGPWVVGGDLNATLFFHERYSKATNQLMEDREFVSWYDNSNLNDMEFLGPKFTWKGGTSEARLDRILSNEGWLELFPNSSVTHLPFFKSDHRPLLLKLDHLNPQEWKNRPFRFIASWVLHEQFDAFVKQEWDNDGSWSVNITHFTEACAKWNVQVFGHTELRKRKLLRRLDGVNGAIGRKGSDSRLAEVQFQLWKELEDVLNQEALLWAQKARLDWSAFGDRNSKYFHQRANRRRKINRVEALKVDSGEWCYDVTKLKRFTTEFFISLFTDEESVRPMLNCPVSFPPIMDNDLDWCGRAITDEEIKEALFSMGSMKSPGPDGFNALFFKNQWNTVCASITKLVKYIFANPQAVKDINGTFIVLIPKKDPPETVRDLRPISLCNVIYKVVTKVIVNRLKRFLPNIISPNQCSFVPGRQSTDNIIVAQEVVHSMRSMRGKKGFMAIKIDLEKAYDRVNWNFLLNCLSEINLPDLLKNMIASCISTSNMQLLWNGDKADMFSSTRGLRQGDPISPYLFVICMEKLAHLIQCAMDKGEWRPIRLSRNGPPISHLFFADDIILFSEASLAQANIINQCLRDFCASSGMKVNSNKTRIFFSPNINHNRCEEIRELFGFQQTGDLGKYLGVKLQHQRVKKDTFKDVVDSVKARIMSWKASAISLAGRRTLVSSVSSTVPNYTMQTCLLPQTTCDDLDKCNRNFLWGSSEDQKRIHLLAWDNVCLPKKKGGLGIRSARKQNQSFMMKLGWNLVNRREDFWARVIREKYRCGTDLLPQIDMNRNGSNTWSGIKKNWGKLSSGLEVVTGDRVRWTGAKSGILSVKTAYESLLPEDLTDDRIWSIIWKVKAPERCRLLVWLAMHGKILTKEILWSRGLNSSNMCSICNSSPETLSHVFRDCHYTKQLWYELVHPSAWRRFCSLGYNDWMRWNLVSNGCSNKEEWRALFSIVCWWLWKRRNLHVFQEKSIANSIVITSARAILRSVHEAHSRFTKVHSIIGPGISSININKWQPPAQGWFKLNIDGAFSYRTCTSASGGVIRDEAGVFIRGFKASIPGGDPLTAELWGFMHGLKMASDLKLRQVVLESDSEEALALVQQVVGEEHEDYNLIMEIKRMVEWDWAIQMKYVRRQFNAAADYLAKEGLMDMPGVTIIQQAPPELQFLLATDRG